MTEPTGGVPNEPGWNVVFADPFLGPQWTLPDSFNKWNIATYGPNRGSGEVQNYTNNVGNVALSGKPQGGLWILPQKDGNGNWTSGRLESKPSFSCDAGGLLLVQANLMLGLAPSWQQNGIWPAFWALGESIRTGTQWPQCGEWDIMENSTGADFTLASLHYGWGSNEQSQGGGLNTNAQQPVKNGQFNTYSFLVDRTSNNWQNESLTWYLNGEEWFHVEGWQVGDVNLWSNVAHSPFFAVLNVAVGNDFPGHGNNGQPDGNTATAFGSGMQVSYVAAYKTNEAFPFNVGQPQGAAAIKSSVKALATKAPQPLKAEGVNASAAESSNQARGHREPSRVPITSDQQVLKADK